MEREKIKISVIIPVYNVAAYLPRCLDSVVGQTYGNLEIILVDDGSTDGGGAICDSYAAEDGRITVIHQKNQGLSAARNTGLQYAAGEFVGFVDSDDWIEPDFYETLLKVQGKNGADIAQVSYREVWEKTSCVRHVKSGCYTRREALILLEQGGLYGYVVTQLYKRQIWDDVRFPADRLPCEDARTMYKLFLRAERIACEDEPKYCYRRRGDSITGSKWIGMEVFSSRYDRYQELRRLEAEGKVFLGCSDIFFEPLAAAAYDAVYLTTKEQREYRGLGRLAREFWRENRREIAGLKRGFWGGYYSAKVYAPRLTALSIKCRRRIAPVAKRLLPPKTVRALKAALGRR